MRTKDKYFILFHTIISYSGIKYFNKIVFVLTILVRSMDAGFLFELVIIHFCHPFKRISRFVLCCKLWMTSQNRTAIHMIFFFKYQSLESGL